MFTVFNSFIIAYRKQYIIKYFYVFSVVHALTGIFNYFNLIKITIKEIKHIQVNTQGYNIIFRFCILIFMSQYKML